MTMRIWFALVAVAACSSSKRSPTPTPTPTPTQVSADAGTEHRRRLAGDLHMHVAPPDTDDVTASIADIPHAAPAVATPSLIPGTEWTTRSGHFTVVGADLAAIHSPSFLDAAHAAGAFISVNHPFAVPRHE